MSSLVEELTDGFSTKVRAGIGGVSDSAATPVILRSVK